ncbi:MAG: protein kinase [Pirellulales bacterium]
MSASDDRILSIFADALACDSPEARAALLDGACGDDTALRAEIEALLKAHHEAGDFLKGRDSPADCASIAEVACQAPGTIIGPYKLLEPIGEGGMGVVYLAEQQTPVHRRVALKIIKPGMDTRQVIARFEVERQALALMDHPNIARVLDAGATDSGRPYFVMELMPGVPITEYCDQNHLTARQRLELFLPVCHAVQHAHQKGIIHRDIKPTNVIVTLHDGQPVPKVIDFGVAKAIRQRLTEKTLFTSFHQMVGTPLYMSPEQAEISSTDVDTRSDVYSLGALLYELLSGTTPFDSERLRESPYDEIRRIIREEEPPRPSTQFRNLGDARTAVADKRRIDPDRLYRILRGDLDWIVMKALEKDRARRYETADALARDIQRFLADQPVEACPPSAAYRFRKYARRNRVALLTALLVSAALVTGIVVSTWQAIRAREAERAAQAAQQDEARQRTEADEQRAQALANYRRARSAIDAYFTLVSEDKLLDVPALQPLRKDLLESALQFYKDFTLEHTNDPELLVDLATTYMRLSEIYHSVDRNDDAVAAIDRAVVVIEHLRRDFPDDRAHHRKLAGYWKGFRRSKTRMEMPKDPEAAFGALTRLIDALQALADENPDELGFQSDIAALCHRTGDLLTSEGKTAKGVPYFERARDILEKLTKAQPEVAERRADLARAYQHLAARLPLIRQKKEAVAAAREGLALREQLVAEFPAVPQYRAELAYSSVQYGSFIVAQNRPDAEKLYRRGLDLSESLAREYPGTLLYDQQFARALVEWAGFVMAGGDPSESQQAVRSLLVQLDAIVAKQPSDPSLRHEIALSLSNLAGRLWGQASMLTLQEELFRRALELYSQLAVDLPENSSSLAQAGHVSRQLGWITRDAGRLDEARKHLENAVAIFEKLSRAQIPQRDGYYRDHQADTLFQVAIVLAMGKRHAEAEPLAARSAELLEELVRDFPTNKHYRGELAYVQRLHAEQLVPTGRPAEAEACLRRSIELNPKDYWTQMLFADLLQEGGRFAEAETCFRRAVEIDPRQFRPRYMLIDVLTRQNKLPQAIDAFGAGRDSFDWFFLALAHSQLGQQEEARKWYDKAVAWMEKHAPKDQQLVRFRAEAEKLLGVQGQPAATAADKDQGSTPPTEP